MAGLHYLFQQFQPFLVASNFSELPEHSPHQLELLCDQTELLADRIYLCDLRSYPLSADTPAQPGAILLLSNAQFTSSLPPLPAGVRAAVFTCPLHKLHNLLAACAADLARWQTQFQSLIDQGGGLHALLSLAAEISGSAVALLDAQGSLVASAGLEQGTYLANQLSTAGVLPQQTLKALFPRPDKDPYGCLAIPGTDLVIHGRRTFHERETFGFLLVEGRKQTASMDVRSLCLCTADFLGHRLFSNDPQRLGSTSKAFQQCWQDIMDGRLASGNDIHNALQQTPFPPKKFVIIATVTFDIDDSHVPYNYLITRLREFFPNSNITFWKKDIVILLSYHERTFHPTLEDGVRRRLTELLTQYHGALMFGNGTRDLESLRSIYLLVKRTLCLCRQLCRMKQNDHIFYYEDFSIYTVIDLAVQRYLEENNRDIIYLCHPGVVLLTRYDRDNNTNLRDTLYYYLLNDRNLVKTAAITYMHRNTVLNKINKIISLTHLDLDDSILRQRLIFSCQLIQYYETIMQREVRP